MASSAKLPPTIVECALAVLNEADPDAKVCLTNAAAAAWRAGEVSCEAPDRPVAAPDRPARPDDRVRLVPARELPQRGKGGSLASRLALLHSLAHIESWAIDLSWDIIARFGRDPSYALPRAFFDDFVAVAEDEARHYALLCARLREEGSHYGALPAHDGLWESAAATRESLPARLAVEHCAHEARGLDVLPQTIARFRRGGDERSAALMSDVIYPEEVTHCAAGVRWISWLHARARGGAVGEGGAGGEAGTREAESRETGSDAGSGDALPSPSSSSPRPAAWAEQARRHETPATWFHELVRAHFRGPLKPPFNDEARAQAGFSTEWYLPLAAGEKEAAT